MQLNPKSFNIVAKQSHLIDPGVENAMLRYEIVKRDGAFLIDLVRHWTTSVYRGPALGTLTTNHRETLATIYPCLDQGKITADSPHDIAGAVARCKSLATQTGIPMTVNLPN